MTKQRAFAVITLCLFHLKELREKVNEPSLIDDETIAEAIQVLLGETNG